VLGRLIASPRRRRRLGILTGVLALAGALAGLALLVPDKKPAPEHFSSAPAKVVVDRTVPVRAAERREIAKVVNGFVVGAVKRQNLSSAYDLVTLALRGGMSRAEWARGTIPVYPYPASGARFPGWTVLYSYRDRVGLELMLRSGARKAPRALSGNLELKRIGGRWLVNSFVPAAVYSAHRIVGTHDFVAGAPSAQATHGRLGAVWLAVPIALVSLFVLVPGGLFLRGWLRSRRIARAYRGG
jgi:hypothetical protein